MLPILQVAIMLEAVWDYSIIFQTLACNSPRRTTSASEEHHVLCWHQGCSLRDGSARTLGAQSGVGSFLFLGSFQVGAQPLLNHPQELVALLQFRHLICWGACMLNETHHHAVSMPQQPLLQPLTQCENVSPWRAASRVLQ